MSLSNQGFQITPSATAVAEAEAILVAAYGSNVNIAPEGPNGQLIQAMAIAITMRENEEAETINSLNPNIAAGQQLDAICSNLDIERIPAINSTATCDFTGLTGVSILAGSQVASTAGDIFTVDTTLVIGLSGTVSGTVTAQEQGQIQVVSNTITTILTAINGWDTVNNPTDGSVGTPAQSDAQLRATRVNQLAFSSAGSEPSINAGAQALNPISYYLINNKSPNSIIRDGLTINANSIMLILDGGGSDLEIGTMLYNRLSGGCGMNGDHFIALPIPDSTEMFVARWQAAIQTPLSLTLQLKVGITYPPNLTNVIANIINENYNFNKIGRPIYASEFTDLLINNGISPIITLVFGVDSLTNLSQYTMPINKSIGSSILSSNVTVSYV